MSGVIIATTIPDEVGEEDTQQTYHCPHCQHQGFLIVRGPQQVNLQDPSLVQRHKPVELAADMAIRCVNPQCPSHFA